MPARARAELGVDLAGDVTYADRLMDHTLHKLTGAAALAACLTATSCLGPNHAYNSLSAWNSEASDNKFLNEAVFLGLHLLPAYPLCMAGDLVIFNSIEFWSGSNPLPAAREFQSQGDLNSGI